MVGWLSISHPQKAWQRLPRDETVNGEWWKPDSPERAVRGKLTIPRFGHPRLHFEGGEELLSVQFLRASDVLRGRIWDLANAPATVFRSVAAWGSQTYALNTPEPRQLRSVDVTINLLLIGRHLSGEDEPSVITSASLVSPYLHGWGWFDGFSNPLMPREQSEFELKFTPQHTEPVRVSDSTSLNFECILHHSGAMIVPDKIDLHQYTTANLQFSKPISLLHVRREIEKLMAFINFCLRRMVDEWDIFLEFQEDSASLASAHSEQQSGAFIQAFQQFQSPKYNQALLTRQELGTELSDSLAAWWLTFDHCGAALAHHLATLGDSIPYVHVRFLSLVQGLEAYHRRFFKGEYEPEKSFKTGLYRTLKDAMPQNLPKQYEDAVFAKLRRLHEYTLESRLSEIYEKHKQLVDFGFQSDHQDLARIRKLRNDLTHGKSPSGMDADEMHQVEGQSRLLLEAAILSRLTANTEMARRQLEGVYSR